MSVNIGSIILPFPAPWSTPVLLSVPLAVRDRHLPSTVRPQCGDAVKLARKCEGGTERGVAFTSGGASRCAASGGGDRYAPSGGEGVRGARTRVSSVSLTP